MSSSGNSSGYACASDASYTAALCSPVANAFYILCSRPYLKRRVPRQPETRKPQLASASCTAPPLHEKDCPSMSASLGLLCPVLLLLSR